MNIFLILVSSILGFTIGGFYAYFKKKDPEIWAVTSSLIAICITAVILNGWFKF